MQTLLCRNDFTRVRLRKTKVVELPELGGAVIVQAMTAGERALYEAAKWNAEGKLIPSRLLTFRERLAVLTVVDDKGEKLFTDEDLPKLAELPASDLDLIAQAAQELAGLTREAEKKAEDLAGNSVAPPSSGSACTSPSTAGEGTGGASSTK